MRKRTTTAILAVCTAALVVSALASAGFAASGKKAAAGDTCLVTDVGGLNDKSFNQLANTGLQKAVKDLGINGRVLTSSSAADYIPNLLSCVQGGADLTIGVGFLMADALNTVAVRFPNSKFAIIDYSFADLPGKPANTRGILFREQEAGYLAGWLAIKELAAQKKPLVIGAVGGVKIPPVDRYIAGYIAGAKAANAKAKVLYGYSQSFTDQSKCKELSLNHIAQGSQVEFGVAGSCGLGSLSAAKDKGLWGNRRRRRSGIPRRPHADERDEARRCRRGSHDQAGEGRHVQGLRQHDLLRPGRRGRPRRRLGQGAGVDHRAGEGAREEDRPGKVKGIPTTVSSHLADG